MNDGLTDPMRYLPGTGWVDRPADVEPTLLEDIACDVVVVGGGLGGMAAAHRLGELGRDVVLLETDLCGWGASARNAGYLTNTVGSDPRILERFYADRLRQLYSFANTAVTFTEGLIERHGIDCDYEQNGILVAAVTSAQRRKLERSLPPGSRAKVLDSAEAGVPATFTGALRVKTGGVLNPGKLAMGMRDVVRRSSVSVFEGTPVLDVQEATDHVRVHVAGGTVRAQQVLLTTNALTSTLAAAPRRLSRPVRITAVETEPIEAGRVDGAGWTSRLAIVTPHFVMESYRTTARGTIVYTTRKVQIPQKPWGDRQPDQAVVADLVRGFRTRFPDLSDVRPAQSWAGLIGMTPSNIAVAGRASDRVFYSMACNGHGLPQAPYLGTLVADHLAGTGMHDELAALWRQSPRFAPGLVNRLTMPAAWVADRVLDRWDSLR